MLQTYNANRAIDRYTLKLDPFYIGGLITIKKDAMVENATAPFLDLEDINNRTRAILGLATEYPVTTTLRQAPMYQAFALSARRLLQKYPGAYFLGSIIDTLCDRWISRGLSPLILGNILTDQLWTTPAPGNFVLVTPANHATNQNKKPTLGWGSSLNADHYVLYLATTTPPASIAAQIPGNVTTWTPTEDLLPATKYYWSVKAYHRNSPLVTPSGVFNFTTMA